MTDSPCDSAKIPAHSTIGMAASVASIITATTTTTLSSPSRSIPTATNGGNAAALSISSNMLFSNPLLYSGSLPTSFPTASMMSSSAPSNEAVAAAAAANEKPANFELLSASLAELNNKLQQQAALAAQQQPSAANHQLVEEQQRLLQAHVRAFLERKQQGSSDKIAYTPSTINNPAFSGSGSGSSSSDDRIEKLKSKSRADCSANASSEVKQRLQEFVLQKRRREAGRSSNWASSQQASTEHGSSPSSSTVGTGDASPPTAIAVRLQGTAAGILLDEAHQLRKTGKADKLSAILNALFNSYDGC